MLQLCFFLLFILGIILMMWLVMITDMIFKLYKADKKKVAVEIPKVEPEPVFEDFNDPLYDDKGDIIDPIEGHINIDDILKEYNDLMSEEDGNERG